MKKLFTTCLLLSAVLSFSQPFRTPVFTGNASTDFKFEEKNFQTGIAYCFTWDATNFFVGFTGLGAYIKDEPTILYLDTDPASSPLGVPEQLMDLIKIGRAHV